MTTTMDGLRKDGIVSTVPFAEPIDFDESSICGTFLYGRTAKHGAFMEGPTSCSRHGSYELLRLGVKIEARKRQTLRATHPKL